MTVTTRTSILFASLALLVTGCSPEPAEEELSLSSQELAITIDTATAEMDEDARVDEDLALSEQEIVDGLVGDQADSVREAVLALAEDEPCALRGVLGGHWFDGEEGRVLRGRAWRRGERLVATGTGNWEPGEDGGGSFSGFYDVLEGGDGNIAGDYGPAAEDSGLGDFSGAWAPSEDAAGGGNLAGVWMAEGDGSYGFFAGYWSRCDAEPAQR